MQGKNRIVSKLFQGIVRQSMLGIESLINFKRFTNNRYYRAVMKKYAQQMVVDTHYIQLTIDRIDNATLNSLLYELWLPNMALVTNMFIQKSSDVEYKYYNSDGILTIFKSNNKNFDIVSMHDRPIFVVLIMVEDLDIFEINRKINHMLKNGLSFKQLSKLDVYQLHKSVLINDDVIKIKNLKIINDKFIFITKNTATTINIERNYIKIKVNYSNTSNYHFTLNNIFKLIEIKDSDFVIISLSEGDELGVPLGTNVTKVNEDSYIIRKYELICSSIISIKPRVNFGVLYFNNKLINSMLNLLKNYSIKCLNTFNTDI